MAYPTAPMPRRIIRSRRDDDFEMGHPTPYKHASAGMVVSIQNDTVTVSILDEELTGVIPLQGMPSVGDFVEVEARGHLLVIPIYTDGPQSLGGWHFIPSESPDWQEGPRGVADERVWHDAPDERGILWNDAVWKVTPDDRLTFTMKVSLLPNSLVCTVHGLYNWAAVNVEPTPNNGEVRGYGDTVTIDGDDIDYTFTATVPDTFTKPGGKELPVGSARIGLRYTPVGV